MTEKAPLRGLSRSGKPGNFAIPDNAWERNLLCAATASSRGADESQSVADQKGAGPQTMTGALFVFMTWIGTASG